MILRTEAPAYCPLAMRYKILFKKNVLHHSRKTKLECETQAILKQNYVEKVILCDLVPPAVSECNTTVMNNKFQVWSYLSDMM